jgi:hypothetical protein
MGNGTDYTPQQVIDARYQEAVNRNDTSWFEVRKITVAFESNFDEFAARTAFELRTRLYYRHDGGKNARGLVRATGDLAAIHKILVTAAPPTAKGSPIHLNAILGRRQDPVATKQWVMVIRFNDSEDFKFIDGKPIVLTADTTSTAKKLMDTVIHHAIMDCPNLPGERGKRICEMARIAEKVGYPANWNLWYYERSLVDEYVDFQRTGNARRREMTLATGGKPPFDGDVAYPPGSWRMYPFRQAAIECAKQPDQNGDNCKAIVHNTLVHAEDEMLRTFSDIYKLTSKAEVADSLGFMGSMWSSDKMSLFGPLAGDFLKSLNDLLNTPDTLYSVYIKYPK